MKVMLRVPLSTYSGYGNDGIGIVQALHRAGVDVRVEPTVAQPPLPEDVALALTKPLDGDFDMTIVHVDPDQLEFQDYLKGSTGLAVGWTMWEFTNFDNLKGKDTLRERLQNFDILVGYDEVSAQCLREYFDGPVLVQQGGFDPSGWEYMEDRNWADDQTYFIMLGVLNERKAPFKAIEAYRDLCNEDPLFKEKARLLMKTSVPGLHSGIEDAFPGVRIFYDTWPVHVVKQFYRNAHCLLAPSRGEGKNLPALEFQATGGAVIATNWGGHLEWRDDEFNYGIDYTLVPSSPGSQALWADVDNEDLKAKMRQVFYNREDAREKGRLASEVIRAQNSWDAVLDRLMLTIGIYGGDKGYAAHNAYVEAPNG